MSVLDLLVQIKVLDTQDNVTRKVADNNPGKVSVQGSVGNHAFYRVDIAASDTHSIDLTALGIADPTLIYVKTVDGDGDPVECEARVADGDWKIVTHFLHCNQAGNPITTESSYDVKNSQSSEVIYAEIFVAGD